MSDLDDEELEATRRLNGADKIKVGEYCRTTEGYIGKFIKEVIPNKTLELEDNKMTWITGIFDIVKHSFNIIDIIEDEDFCKIEFYSPRYKERVTRIFEVSKIGEYITFENFHCELFMIRGEWSCHDKQLNAVIKEVYTKEQMEFISYKLKE